MNQNPGNGTGHNKDEKDEIIQPARMEFMFGELGLRRVPAEGAILHKTKWLIEKHWVLNGTGILAGVPKLGKTWLVLDIALSVASGQPFLGKFEVASGPVLMYSPEGPVEELEHRIRRLANHRGLDATGLPLFLMDKSELLLDNPKDQKIIRQAVDTIQPQLIIFDPLSECFSGDENQSTPVKAMSRVLTQLAREAKTSVMLTHHCTKDGADMRGSSALKAFGDSYLYLDEDDLGKSF